QIVRNRANKESLRQVTITFNTLDQFATLFSSRRTESVFVRGQKNDDVATDPEKAPAAMAEAVLHFNEQPERLGELTVVLLIGAMVSWTVIPVHAAWFVPLVLLVISPHISRYL
ncbi:MAG TPA: hypothetical protein VLL94_04830, partial [Nitrospiraceae bacterium]|nr:hypothetical protein [Nitrospiraceae bacterium]